jgi:hypothetical protein
MYKSPPSALVTDQGLRVRLRLEGRFYELGQDELRTILGLPEGPAGLGITVERDRFQFEFAADKQTAKMSARQLHRCLAKQLAKKS